MTVELGWHASHEQIPPSRLLADARLAEEVGFRRGMCSDHFSPWAEAQGESGFAWSWLGAALATTGMSFGVVNAPGGRYHPAVVAQASATLAEMFPGRFWMALGTGENSNEHITGGEWPRKDVRNARLAECVDVIRRLHRGEVVNHDGLVTVDRARLWTLPAEPPPLVGTAVTAETARTVGGWADALITVNQAHDKLRAVLEAFREGGGEGPAYLQVHVSYAETDDDALAVAYHQWRNNVFEPPVCWDLETVEQFDVVGAKVRPEDVAEVVRVSGDLGQHAAWIAEYADLGFDAVYLHHVGQSQRLFLERFGEHVLPQFAAPAPVA